jgi:uncharacterized membrane protein
MEFILLVVAILLIFTLLKRIGFLENALKDIDYELKKLKTEVVQLQNQAKVPFDTTSQAPVSQPKVYIQPLDALAKNGSTLTDTRPTQATHSSSDTVTKTQTPIRTQKPENQFNLIDWIKKDFLVKVGGFFMVIALAWFVSFAFANDWIGPEGRVSIGVLVGAMMMILGYWQLPKNPAPARVITLVGTTTILVTLYTAHAILGLFTPTIILFGMVITIAFTVLISIVQDSRSVGVIAMTGSYLVPFLTGSTTNDFNGLFIYITIINIASLALIYAKGWRVLQFISMLITFSLSYFLSIDFGVNKWIYLSIFILLFQSSFIYAILKTKKLIHMDIFNSIISTLISISWVAAYVNSEFRTISFVGLSIATFAIALLFDRNQATKSYTYVQLIASLTTLVFATYLQFAGNNYAFIIVFTFEILASQWLLSKIFDDSKPFYILPYLNVIPVLYFLDISSRAINDVYYSVITVNSSSTTDLVSNIALNIFIIAAIYINAVLIDYSKYNSTNLRIYSKALKIVSCSLVVTLLINIHGFIVQFYSLSYDQMINYSIPLLLGIGTIFSIVLATYKPLSPNTSFKNFGYIALFASTGLQLLQANQTSSLERVIIWFIFTIISICILSNINVLKTKIYEYLGYMLLAGSLSLQLLTNITQSDSTLRVIVYVVTLLVVLYLRLTSRFDKQFFTQRVSDISLGFILLVLVFIELWALGIVIRIITFVGVGVLLILTGFAKKKS